MCIFSFFGTKQNFSKLLYKTPTRTALSRVHNSSKAQQSPYETTFNSQDLDFYLDLHHIPHTHEYQSTKHAWYFSWSFHPGSDLDLH